MKDTFFLPSVFMAYLHPGQAHSLFRIKAQELEEHTFLHSDLLNKDWDKMDWKQLRKEKISAGEKKKKTKRG